MEEDKQQVQANTDPNKYVFSLNTKPKYESKPVKFRKFEIQCQLMRSRSADLADTLKVPMTTTPPP